MKNLLKLTLFVIIVSAKLPAQWYHQNINAVGYFGGFQFVNENTGWVFSNNPSKIFKTTNRGENWLLQHEPDGPITARFFLDENHGWYVDLDANGVRLIYTSDGGQNWITRSSLVFSFFDDLHFFDLQNGIAAGSIGAPQYGAIFKSSDGGANWQIAHYDLYGMFSSISFLDSLVGWVGGWSMTNSNILKTTDGGSTWIPLVSGPDGSVFKLIFFDEMTSWVNSSYRLYNTSNGGISWNLVIQDIDDFHFVDPNKGWYIKNDNIFHTTDGGSSWQLQFSNPGNNLLSIYFFNALLGWASGYDGMILHTDNGGVPVELMSFTATASETSVLLEWITATEINNQGFEIQRQSGSKQNATGNGPDGGVNWDVIGFVGGNGTTTEINYYSFVDEGLLPGKYFYRLKQIDFDGAYEFSGEIEVEVGIPDKFYLSQNYPNPFNPTTKIKFSIPQVDSPLPGGVRGGFITLKVYDVLGREVATLVNEERPAGYFEVIFDASNISSGIYYYQLRVGSFIETKKMILLR